jgi:hypothetical protein
MSKKIKVIKVTRAHIKKGVLLASKHCPIALALREAGFEAPNVYGETFSYGPFPSRFEGQLSKATTDFVHSFDWGLKVRPGIFRVYI